MYDNSRLCELSHCLIQCITFKRPTFLLSLKHIVFVVFKRLLMYDIYFSRVSSIVISRLVWHRGYSVPRLSGDLSDGPGLHDESN